ncbi:uncharacterized protein LOC119068938 [Bradysia coprophila]|uniref:uncharacterized protein LOC119068938 n=1 Tax=Bradysia coprophila TaxID=38358 RepID=UPI00187DD9A9|nr:uncharacterized protein LOC119068938 [Bradysia coprophila]
MAVKSNISILLVCFFITQICVGAVEPECDGVNNRIPSPEGRCDIFYECIEDEGLIVPSQVSCDTICSGCHFSTEALDCVHPDEALCLPELRKLTCTNVTDIIAHPTNCARFFTCDSLRPTVADCSLSI